MSSGVTVTYTLWRLLWSITDYSTCKSVDVIWRGFDAICVLCPLIDHGQQPMKMYSELPK